MDSMEREATADTRALSARIEAVQHEIRSVSLQIAQLVNPPFFPSNLSRPPQPQSHPFSMAPFAVVEPSFASQAGVSSSFSRGGASNDAVRTPPSDPFKPPNAPTAPSAPTVRPTLRGPLPSKNVGNTTLLRPASVDPATMALILQLEEQNRKEQEQIERDMLFAQGLAEPVFTCCVCQDDQSIQNVFRANDCSHEMCRECMRQYVRTQLEQRAVPVKCPQCMVQAGPKYEFTEAELAHVLSPEEVERYTTLCWELYISANPQLVRRCPAPDCKGCLWVDDPQVIELNCPLCMHQWCDRCKSSPYHSGQSCEERKREAQALDEKQFQDYMRERKFQQCPTCKTAIEKTMDCNHMVCQVCKTDFCYVCGESFPKPGRGIEIPHYRSGGNCLLFDEHELGEDRP